MSDDKYETGNRKPVERKWPDPVDAFSQDAAENKKPAGPYGNTAPVDEDEEKVRHSEGQKPPGYYENIGNEPRGSSEPGYVHPAETHVETLIAGCEPDSRTPRVVAGRARSPQTAPRVSTNPTAPDR